MYLNHKVGRNRRLCIQHLEDVVLVDNQPYLNPRGVVEIQKKIDRKLGQGLAKLCDGDKPPSMCSVDVRLVKKWMPT